MKEQTQNFQAKEPKYEVWHIKTLKTAHVLEPMLDEYHLIWKKERHHIKRVLLKH